MKKVWGQRLVGRKRQSSDEGVDLSAFRRVPGFWQRRWMGIAAPISHGRDKNNFGWMNRLIMALAREIGCPLMTGQLPGSGDPGYSATSKR
ncbi:MAG: hypothetical protein GVY08_11415 [Bacteroidetes bacterium]|nr:hypothetical protein [Bacteroidota bacterium]